MPARSKTIPAHESSPGSAPAKSPLERQIASPNPGSLAAKIGELSRLDLAQLRLRWRNDLGGTFPDHLPKWLLPRVLAYRMQAETLGGLDPEMLRAIRGKSAGAGEGSGARFAPRSPKTTNGISLRPGALLVREWQGQLHRVMIVADGFAWNGETYPSLSKVANAITGAHWNGHRFFGLRKPRIDGVGGAVDAR